MSKISGRVWKFGDQVNTDLIFPGKAFRMSVAEQAEVLFDTHRPEWPQLVQPGDILVAGHNFGIGSARPIGNPLLHLGVTAVLADSMSAIFQRSCLNSGLFAMPVHEVAELCEEGDSLDIDIDRGIVVNTQNDREASFIPLPEQVRAILDAGGVLPMLRRDGYLPLADDSTLL
ncbi:MAG: hypothetical protein OXC05_13105 [Halieaceae bacterium]|nr:hypothetical protein [Halieaceae bacterium]